MKTQTMAFSGFRLWVNCSSAYGRWAVWGGALLVLLLPLHTGAQTLALPSPPHDGGCLAAISQAERAERLPANLLLSVALTESGRKTQAGFLPWPWTINVDGRGLYLDSRQDALAIVERLFAQGARNIDFGCLQISSLHHPQAFRSLNEAFDPSKNASYAARFLRQLYQQTGSWETAVGRYHSADPQRGDAYRLRVLATWRGDRHLAEDHAAEVERLQGPLLSAWRLMSSDPGAAADAFSAVLQATPGDLVALAGRATALQRSGRAGSAYEDLESLYLTNGPQGRTAWQQMARFLGSIPLKERILRLERLVTLRPDDSRPREWLVRDSLAAGDDARAWRHKQALIALHPTEGRLYRDAIPLAIRVGDPAEALRLSTAALALPASALTDDERAEIARTARQLSAPSPSHDLDPSGEMETHSRKAPLR